SSVRSCSAAWIPPRSIARNRIFARSRRPCSFTTSTTSATPPPKKGSRHSSEIREKRRRRTGIPAAISAGAKCRSIRGTTLISTARPVSTDNSTCSRTGPTASRVAKVSTPISATGISTDASITVRRLVRNGRGFTLLELLVVVTIIGLLAGSIVLSTRYINTERELEREVLRLQSLIDLVREEALMQSREFALLFAESGYRFYVYDHLAQRWVAPPGDRLLASYSLPEPIRTELRLEGRDLVLEPTLELASRG